jgi:hypothetical protein
MGDPFGLDYLGDQRVRQCRTELDAGGSSAIEQLHHDRPARFKGLHMPHPAVFVAPVGVAEHPKARGDQLFGHLAGVSPDHLCAAAEVSLGDRGCRGISIHRDNLQTSSKECHGVGADAAAEVDHPPNTGVDEPARVVVSDIGSRCLLQARSGEVQPGGGIAELGPRLPAQ